MDEDWRNAFEILMCSVICDDAGVGICDGAPSTCSSYIDFFLLFFYPKYSFFFTGFSTKI